MINVDLCVISLGVNDCGNRAGQKITTTTLDSILSIGNLKAHPYSDTLKHTLTVAHPSNKAIPSPTKPCFLTVTLPVRVWEPITFKLP